MDTAAAHYGDWRFERTGGLCRVVGGHGLCFAASAAAAGSGLAGVDALGVPAAPVPRGALRHTLSLRFRSRGFFRAEPAAHVALGVTGEWRKADPNAADWNGRLAGRGAILGNVSGAPGGCAEAPVLQLESFHARGNALIAGSASPRLAEEHWYALELHADLGGRLGCRLHDETGRLLHAAEVDDAGADVPPGLGGWWITHVFSDLHPQQDWALDLVDLRTHWR